MSEQLSMSMFANRADYDAAVRAQAEQLPDWLQQTGINSPFNACMYRDDCRSEHAQRVTLQHHACDLAQRAADLEAERDELRARLAEIEAQEPAAWAPSIVAGPEARTLAGMGQSLTVWFDKPDAGHLGRGHCQTPLFTRPVPAQAVPDGWRLTAWAHEDGRVIPVATMDTAKRDGGATFSSVKAYTIPLYAAPEHKA